MASMARVFRKSLRWSALALMVSSQSSLAPAQQVPNKKMPERYQSIAGDSLSLTSIDVAAMRGRKELEIVPWEIISALGKQELQC